MFFRTIVIRVRGESVAPERRISFLREGPRWGMARTPAGLSRARNYLPSPAPPVLRFLCLSVNSDLLEVGISGHGADRCDQDDEIYLMVQEIRSGSAILGVKLILECKIMHRVDYRTTG